MDSGNIGNNQSSSDGYNQSYGSRATASSVSVSNMIPISTNYTIQLQQNPRADVNYPNNTVINSTTTTINTTSTSSLQPPSTVARSSKKRSRASRRVPTTVLTTDTTNFRSMVQEYTGIPFTPFTPSLSSRAQIDHSRPTAATDASHAMSAYLRRPFPEKIQPYLTTNITNPINKSYSSNVTSISRNDTSKYQLPSCTQALTFHDVATNLHLHATTTKLISATSTDVDGQDHSQLHVSIKMDGLDQEFNFGHNKEHFIADETHHGQLLRPIKMVKYNGELSDLYDKSLDQNVALTRNNEGI